MIALIKVERVFVQDSHWNQATKDAVILAWGKLIFSLLTDNQYVGWQVYAP
ncbi:hypothetical protein KSX_20590 [Ktedonospora formicarum]|uniref:Uncharacterized protein n=1 Tax=Ktedonospora formicarum TaxID=2778364 RepID=A0A8J3HVA9_9CHLR|nr:hypothetical protein KSX_20590 [Ktedonospora formicarum]